MTPLEILFWTLTGFGLYPYLGYPVVVWLLGLVVNRPVRADPAYRPTVTIIIAAHNEARVIEATVRNKLSQDYPNECFDILVVSDGSSDETDTIVQRISSECCRVSFVRQEVRQGKSAALNIAVRHATGELLVFSDANSIYRPDALAKLVQNFADPQVGMVTGKMLYSNPDESLVGDGCTAYMAYENFLRAMETRIGSIVGVDGAIDCVRGKLYRPMHPDQLPDFVLALDVTEQGYRVVYEDHAVVTEEALGTDYEEHRMRVRVALRGLWAMWDKRLLLNPIRHPLFSWQLASHKLLRYLSPAPLLLAAVINWALLDSGSIYRIAAIGQLLYFFLVVSRFLKLPLIADLAIARYCYYFALMNWSSAVATLQFLRGQKRVVWQPRVG